jgi:hypothetical protein
VGANAPGADACCSRISDVRARALCQFWLAGGLHDEIDRVSWRVNDAGLEFEKRRGAGAQRARGVRDQERDLVLAVGAHGVGFARTQNQIQQHLFQTKDLGGARDVDIRGWIGLRYE